MRSSARFTSASGSRWLSSTNFSQADPKHAFFNSRFELFFEPRENFLDLAVKREAAGAGFRENQLAVDDHVELTRFAGGNFGFFSEPGIE
jgi:hypothetical protein